jgi:hypothetical protein
MSPLPHTDRGKIQPNLNRCKYPGGVALKKAIAFSALPLAFLFVTAFQSSNSLPTQLAVMASNIEALKAQVDFLAANNKGPRKFYLTRNTNDGAQASVACTPGYHMASLWEIHDPSNLRYNTELGLIQADSGVGPPTGVLGWIRTGGSSVNAGFPGFANCSTWTSDSNAERGTLVKLSSEWLSTANYVDPWTSGLAPCNSTQQVWCVQD